LFLSSNEKGATATVVVFLRVLPFGETFSILRHVSGFVKKKRASRVERGRPMVAPTVRSFSGTGFCVENKRKGVCPCACNARGVVIY